MTKLMTHAETQAIIGWLNRRADYPGYGTAFAECAALLTRQQEEIERLREGYSRIEDARSLMDAYDRVHAALNSGKDWSEIDNGLLKPDVTYEAWLGYMMEFFKDSIRAALQAKPDDGVNETFTLSEDTSQ